MDYYKRLKFVAMKIDLKHSTFFETPEDEIEKAVEDIKAVVIDLGYQPLILRYSSFQVSDVPKALAEDKPGPEWVIIAILDQPFTVNRGYTFMKSLGDYEKRKAYRGMHFPKGLFTPLEQAIIRSGVVVTTEETLSQVPRDASNIFDYYSNC